MELEQIYNDLYNWWNALPEPKVSWEKAFYGGIKDTIEMRLTYPLVEKPSLDLKVARTLKDMFETGCFSESMCTSEEIDNVEEWIHTVLISDMHSESQGIKTMGGILRESINEGIKEEK